MRTSYKQNSLGPLGDIIVKCGHDKYSDAKSVCREIEAISIPLVVQKEHIG